MMVKEHQQERGKEIGARIATARKEADGMTQRELADLLGVTERSVAAYEAGTVIPYRFMRQLEQLLNRPASWMLYGDAGGSSDETLAALIKGQQDMKDLLAEIVALLRDGANPTK